jgi:bifunctional UDP-N-acetylglucosamine pyrophosphorylase/glucosamine-1-phosphate N-acetyltransferase
MSTHVLILAAGQGTRMRSSEPKVLHHLAGLPLIEHVLRAALALPPVSTSVVVGHLANLVRAGLSHHHKLGFVHQSEQLGTGHALLEAESLFAGHVGTLVVLSGDVPLVRPETLRRLVDTHTASAAAVTVVTATVTHPYGYGRIVRKDGRLIRVVEERDASEAQRRLKEINSGVYAFDLAPLFDALRQIPSTGAANEVYLPDLVSIYRRRGLPVETLKVTDQEEVRGINSQTELAEVKNVVRQRKNEELMAAGVMIEDPATTYIDMDVVIGPDTVIHPGVTLEGRTTVGDRCELHGGVRIVDSTLGADVLVRNHCVIQGASIARGAKIGPFAHLRPGTRVDEEAQIGNFVETKKTSLGRGAKANHLSYLGDATIGSEVNIGAGTITCNYDQGKKHPTSIGDRVFIGSGSELVAPVTIGDDAYVAAGSCITEDVPPNAMGISRNRQVNKDGWVNRRKAHLQTSTSSSPTSDD